MHRYCKLLLGSAATLALISGATMLTTTEASAQINIEGLIRGAMSHGYYGGYSYRHHRGRVHESSHERRSKKHEEADDEGSSKGKDDHSADVGNKVNVKPSTAANQVNPGSNNGQHPETAASNTVTPAQAPAPAPAPKPNNDIPAFSPSR